MTRRRSPILDLALRLLLAAACLLPFTGASSAAAFLRAAPTMNTAPVVPANQEDEREEAAGEVQAAQERNDRPAPPGSAALLTVPRPTWFPTPGPSRPTAADPFRARTPGRDSYPWRSGSRHRCRS